VLGVSDSPCHATPRAQQYGRAREVFREVRLHSGGVRRWLLLWFREVRDSCCGQERCAGGGERGTAFTGVSRGCAVVLVLCHAEKLGLSRLWRTVSAAAKEKSPLPRSRERVASEASRVRACERSAPDAWFPQAIAPSSALRAPSPRRGEGTGFGRRRHRSIQPAVQTPSCWPQTTSQIFDLTKH